MDSHGYVQQVNRQAAVWLESDPGNMIGRLFWDTVADENVRSVSARVISALRSKTVEDVRMLSPREMDLRMIFVPIPKNEIILILLNVSGEKACESQKQMAARHESLVRLAAGIAHEIGNPLNAINIHLGLMRKQMDALPASKAGPLKEAVEILTGETGRLDRIVRNFLKATRRPPLRFRGEDLNVVLKNVIEFLRPELDKRKIQISLRTDASLSAFYFDWERIYEAVLNLVKNAMEAMPGGGKLRVALSHRERVAILRVTDEGKGIADADLEHIFDAYYTTKEEGSGLGLWMVYHVVAEHGGRIEVMTKEGKGTTFTVLLPIRRPKLQLPKYELTKMDHARKT